MENLAKLNPFFSVRYKTYQKPASGPALQTNAEAP